MRDGNEHVMISEIIDIAMRQGSAFEASTVFSISVGLVNATSTLFRNNSNKLIILYSRRVSYDGGGLNLRVYRDPVYTGGTVIPDIIRNPNDINPVDPVTELVTGATVTSKGIETRSPEYIFGNQTGSGGGSPNQTIYSPQFVRPGKTLLLEIESRVGTQVVSSKLEWVEVSRIPSIVSDDNYVTARYTGVSLDERN